MRRITRAPRAIPSIATLEIVAASNKNKNNYISEDDFMLKEIFAFSLDFTRHKYIQIPISYKQISCQDENCGEGITITTYILHSVLWDQVLFPIW